jgi:hypothetical protein
MNPAEMKNAFFISHTSFFLPAILLCRGLSILNLHANFSCNF